LTDAQTVATTASADASLRRPRCSVRNWVVFAYTVRYIRAVIHQSPDSEDLFSAWSVGAVFGTRTKQMREEIDRMDPDVLLASDPEALAERLAGQY
jgi:hypothetical protein